MFRRRRRLVRGAVVAGGAYSAGGHAVNEQPAGQPDAAAAAELEELERLHDQGDLTDDEFAARKTTILAP